MKRMILALVATMTMTAAMAQGDNKQGKSDRKFDKTEMIKHRTDDAVKRYGLNEEQAAKLLSLNTKYADKMGPRMGGRGGRGMRPRPNFGGNDQQGQRPEMTDEMKAQMKAQREEHQKAMQAYDTELQAIMTADQYKAYKADMEKRMKEGPRRGGGQRPDKKEKN